MRVTITDDEGVVFAIHELSGEEAGKALRHATSTLISWHGAGLHPDTREAVTDKVEQLFDDLRAAARKEEA